MKYMAALMKTHRLPQAKGMPARTGEIQWIEGRAVQANQKRLGSGILVSEFERQTEVKTYPIEMPKLPSCAHMSLYSGGGARLPSPRTRLRCLR